MPNKTLAIDLLRLDADTQTRIATHEETVETYSEVVSSNDDWVLGPIDVFHDGTEYFVADGFHRTLAAQRAKRASVPVRLHKGTAYDAKLFGMTANDKHGLRMSREDKRACVEWLLDNGGKMTQTQVADIAGVSRRTVSHIVAERKAKIVQTSQTIGGGNEQTSERSEPGGDSLSTSLEKTDSASSPVMGADAGNTGSDVVTDDGSTDAVETVSGTAGDATDDTADLGKCPNCAGDKWKQDEDGAHCAKCYHPHGEPAGDVDAERIATQRAKTVKTAEALLRAFDDLNLLLPHDAYNDAIKDTKSALRIAKGWK